MLFALALVAGTHASQLQIETVRNLSYEVTDQRLRLRRITGTQALFFQSKMSCDVDGSPNAYHPLDDNLSLDVIGSAGGRRKGDLPNGPLVVQPSPEVVVYVDGKPYLQPNGEFAGFYVSETSFQNPGLAATDPAHYLDARRNQYIVLPGGLVPEAEVGDVAVVYDPHSKKAVYAVYGDIGPSSESGEVSLATIQRLGLPATDGKSSPGQSRDDLFYLVFPHTGQRLMSAEPGPLAQSTVDRLGADQLAAWGGTERIEQILAQDPEGGSIGDVPANTPVFDELAWDEKSLRVIGDYGLPARYQDGANDRLPCAPEVVGSMRQAISALQHRIDDAEKGRKEMSQQELSAAKVHLATQLAIIERFPIASRDEEVSLVKERARVTALDARVGRLAAKSAAPTPYLRSAPSGKKGLQTFFGLLTISSGIGSIMALGKVKSQGRPMSRKRPPKGSSRLSLEG